ncbi:MAG TPA: iron-containing redox enzyme family protein [Candidatus Binatia bacterium]|nr:iron-containing redox enzyme family protein [Candidatus Binatia bacterium]
MGPASERQLTPREFVEECYAFKLEHAPRGRFMRRLLAGECSRAELVLWAKDAHYYTEPAVPSVAAWLSHAPIVPDRGIYGALARNLAGEMGYIREAEHYELYVQFLAGLGVSREEVRAHVPLASTLGAAAAVGYFCRSSFEEGLGAFGLAVEMQVPGRAVGAEVIYTALRDHYGLDAKTLEFYAIHVEAEDEHGENAMKAVEWFAATAVQQACVRRAFRWSVLAHTAMAEGYDRLLDP